MVKIIKGGLKGKGKKIGIVAGRFNDFITNKLIAGALKCLALNKVADKNITLAWVPGAFEIPFTAQEMAKKGKFDAIICLGAVIRGETPHFEYVASEAASGISMVGMEYSLPVIFGVLTTDTVDQAHARSGEDRDNSGFRAAETALEMIEVIKKISN